MTDPFYYLLPGLLVFAITYGALEVAGVIKNSRVNGVIALVIAFFAISSPQVVQLTYSVMPYMALLFIAIFFIGILLSPIRGGEKQKNYELIAIICALGLVWLSSQESLVARLLPGLPKTDLLTILGLILIIIIFLMVYRAWG
ncbi:MAG: hypothetical protein DRP12_03135 [Candidatus Aenigmatarchaeota archaeon]|nr:MAG: hypothetical protein DRP12_03135 [Candidatus Aenigmarchaeota archaeon]